MTELQAAFSLSMSEFNGFDPRIQEAANAGFWVVVEEAVAYCRFTDGMLGTHKTLLAVADCQAQAEEFCEACFGDWNDDVTYFVQGPEMP